MKKNDLNLPEWAFLDADNHTGNALEGRVLLHVRTNTVMEFLSPLILNMSDAEFKNTFCDYTTITKRFGSHKSYSREKIHG